MRHLTGVHLPADQRHNTPGCEPAVRPDDAMGRIKDAVMWGEVGRQGESIVGKGDPWHTQYLL